MVRERQYINCEQSTKPFRDTPTLSHTHTHTLSLSFLSIIIMYYRSMLTEFYTYLGILFMWRPRNSLSLRKKVSRIEFDHIDSSRI